MCEQCWRIFVHASALECPAKECRASRPSSGWKTLPYRFRGHYQLVRQLGRGGMGAVFVAHDEEATDGAKGAVALKVAQQRPTSIPEEVKRRFAKEAGAQAILGEHEEFVKVVAHDVCDPAFLAMELVGFKTLDQLVGRSASGRLNVLPVATTLRIGIGLLDGVMKMHHAHKIVHRDLKPANLFVGELGGKVRVKIADFGLWTFDDAARAEASIEPSATATLPVGTLAYMSPEQVSTLPIGTASDIHSVGSILWELITGELPFPLHGATYQERLEDRASRLKKPPARPAKMPQDVFLCLAGTVEHAPEKRPSAKTLRETLQSLLQQREAQLQRRKGEILDQARLIETRIAALKGKIALVGKLQIDLDALEQRAASAKKGALDDDIDPIAAQLATIARELADVEAMVPDAVAYAKTEDPVIGEKRRHVRALGLAVLVLGGGVGFGAAHLFRHEPPVVTCPEIKPRPEPQVIPLVAACPEVKPCPEQEIIPPPRHPLVEGNMLVVPAGPFFMGCNEEVDKECFYAEKSDPRKQLATFLIDRTEVSVEEYAKCVAAGSCSAEGLEMAFADHKEQASYKHDCNWRVEGRERHPINCLTWMQASAYCKFVGKRLPTNAEWEKAARGTSGNNYPWGNDWLQPFIPLAGIETSTPTPNANIQDETMKKHRPAATPVPGYDDGFDSTAPVDAFPKGASPYGALNMIGNVAEWTADSDHTGAFRIVRGDSYLSPSKHTLASNRYRVDPTDHRPDVGMRCAL